jgi:hypothetical protein
MRATTQRLTEKAESHPAENAQAEHAARARLLNR